MKEGKLFDDKLYEIAIQCSQHTEKRRDEINTFYISLFSAMISITPFVSGITDKISKPFGVTINIFLIIIALAGLALSIGWITMLRRINYYLKAVEHFMISIEKEHDRKFITFVSEYLGQTSIPNRITEQQMLIPYVFMTIFGILFSSAVAYDLWCIYK